MMSTRISVRCLLTMLIVLGSAAVGAAQPAVGPSSLRIQKKSYDFKEAGKEMEYALFVPSGYDKAKNTPLIVALHGLGSNPQQIIRYRGLTDLAEKHGYIVVAPMGYNSRGWYGIKFPGKRNPADPENLSELSEKDVMNVLQIVRKDYNVDPDRIYLLGHSMGGGGAIHLAVKYPDLWAGLAPLAPALFRPVADLAKIKHIPLIMVQGEKDKLCPVDVARRWAAEMKRLEMPHQYIEVAGGDHVTVAWRHFDEVFQFFEKHRRPARSKPDAK